MNLRLTVIEKKKGGGGGRGFITGSKVTGKKRGAAFVEFLHCLSLRVVGRQLPPQQNNSAREE